MDAIVKRLLSGEDQLLNPSEASALTKRTVSTLYQKVHRKEIPFYKAEGGGKLLFSRVELLQWLTADRTPTASETTAKSNEALCVSVSRSVKRRRK